MRDRWKYPLKVLLVLTVLLAAVSWSSGILDEQVKRYPTTYGDYGEIGHFRIDARTILQSIDAGATDIFVPAIDSPDSYPTSVGGRYAWGQVDYLKIANSLHEAVWGEPLDEWNLFGMMFWSDCGEDLSGFASGDFVFFRTVVSGLKIRQSTREMIIYPLANGVIWAGSRYFPRPLLGWRGIDLDRLAITADDALALAEEIGGREARKAVNNNCDIFLALGGNVWLVRYERKNGETIFEARIDPYTGKYEIRERN